MTGVIVISIIIYLIYIATKKKEPNQQNYKTSKENIEEKLENEAIDKLIEDINNGITITVTNSTGKDDDSIIDITDQSYKLKINRGLQKYSDGVPYWSHQYVYSFSEINDASPEQKQFYKSFKANFLNDISIDLEGNTNYAFILLFDLLNDFAFNKDIRELENQLKVLGQFYPKTKSYGMNFLIKKMENIGDEDGISRLQVEERERYQANYDSYDTTGSDYDYDYWRLGRQYQTKLDLTDEEVTLLNHLWPPSNNFGGIEFCRVEIIKLFIVLVAEMKSKCEQEETTLDEELKILADLIVRKHYRYRKGSWNFKSALDYVPRDIFGNIFKHCENAVRAEYGHKRKLNTDTYYVNEEVKTAFESKIFSKIEALMPKLVSEISMPDEATEIELNAQTTTRWKIKFEALKIEYTQAPKQLEVEIMNLAELNKENRSVKNIFFEAAKFSSKFDKESALKFYIYYIYNDLKSAKFNNKQLSKTIKKILFKTTEQLLDFEKIVSELIDDKDINKALAKVSKIYEIKRKRIKLNTTVIKEVQQEHSGTVELLNEYLQDEFENEPVATESIKNKTEVIEVRPTSEKQADSKSPFLPELNFNSAQINALQLFEKSGFTLSDEEITTFAKTNGIFKNQLIESINETCYDFLDGVLIEEEDEDYTIDINYFEKISTK